MATRPGLDAYDLAESGYRFLLDRFGAARTRGCFGGRAPREALGSDVVRRGESIDVGIDDLKVLSAKGSDTLARPGLGVDGGSAVFENVRVRRLP